MTTSPEKRPTILLVEDEQALLEITQLNLESMGFDVEAAHSASRALEVFHLDPQGIDLLVTDVIMPEMNGRALFEKVRGVRPDLKCLYLSGYPADIIGRRGIIPEEVNFLAKPYTRAQLKEMIESILSSD